MREEILRAYLDLLEIKEHQIPQLGYHLVASKDEITIETSKSGVRITPNTIELEHEKENKVSMELTTEEKLLLLGFFQTVLEMPSYASEVKVPIRNVILLTVNGFLAFSKRQGVLYILTTLTPKSKVFHLDKTVYDIILMLRRGIRTEFNWKGISFTAKGIKVGKNFISYNRIYGMEMDSLLSWKGLIREIYFDKVAIERQENTISVRDEEEKILEGDHITRNSLREAIYLGKTKLGGLPWS